MSKVVQIRNVPDDVHRALTEVAHSHGLSLNKYVLRELQNVAARAQAVGRNSAIIHETQGHVGGQADRQQILSILHEGRDS